MNIKILAGGLILIILSVSIGVLPRFHRDTVEYYNVSYTEEIPKQIIVEYPVNRTITRVDPLYQNNTVYPNIWSARTVFIENSTIVTE